jgi:Fe-Mn family superoxide dismutase
MSCETVIFHFSLHQRTCVERTTALTRGTTLELLALEELMHATSQARNYGALRHYAAEAWSHEFFWKSMRPPTSGGPRGLIDECIRRDFGTYNGFVRSVHRAADTLLGNGWLWLTWGHGKLHIITTTNAGTPHEMGHTPLLALDLWEHAYYLDHQNRRSAYVAAFLDELANWELASAIIGKQAGTTPARAARKSLNVPALVAEAPKGVTHHAAAHLSTEYPGARGHPQAAGASEPRGVRQFQ